MKTGTRKTRTRKRVAAAEPPKAEPLTDERILAQLDRFARVCATAYEDSKVVFLSKFAEDPTEAFTWAAAKLLTLQGEHETWARVGEFIADNRGSLSSIDLMQGLAEGTREEIDRIVDGQLWRRLTSSAMGDAAFGAKLGGRAKALSTIREFTRWAVTEIKKREG
jgi:hypothetical protein